MGVMDRKKANRQKRGAYVVEKERPDVRKLVSLPADLVDFVDELAFEVKKEEGRRMTATNILRSALRSFKALPRDKQKELLE